MSARTETFISRWGDAELDDRQYVSVPGWILRHYHKFSDPDGNIVGLTADEFQIMLHIMSFKFDVPGAEARPGIPTIAEQVGKTVRSIQRTIKRMEEKGALTVDRSKKGHPNTYDFGGMVRQCRQYEHAALTNKDANVTPDVHVTPTPDVHVTPPLTYTSPEDQKKEQEDKSSSAGAKKPRRPRRTKKTFPAEQINPVKDRIVELFGWDWDTMTPNEAGQVQKAAYNWLAGKGTPEQLDRVYAYCQREYENFKPTALPANKSRALSDTKRATVGPGTKGGPPPAPSEDIYGDAGAYIPLDEHGQYRAAKAVMA
jgi:hypothetical protein